MNSAAMRFIPKEDLEKEGYGNIKDFSSKRNNLHFGVLFSGGFRGIQ